MALTPPAEAACSPFSTCCWPSNTPNKQGGWGKDSSYRKVMIETETNNISAWLFFFNVFTIIISFDLHTTLWRQQRRNDHLHCIKRQKLWGTSCLALGHRAGALLQWDWNHPKGAQIVTDSRNRGLVEWPKNIHQFHVKVCSPNSQSRVLFHPPWHSLPFSLV